MSLEFPCRSCGAKLVFAPGTETLRCEYCGYAEAVAASEERVEERPFEDYKPDAGGWDADLKRWGCIQCGALTEVAPHVTAWSCPFCGSDRVEEQTETRALHKPESVLPFSVDQDGCLRAFRGWVHGLWFRPNALKTLARPDRLRGVYLPFWSYDTLTASFWHAESGTWYYVEDDRGNRVRKTRWRPVSGEHHEFFDDVLVPGSPSVPSDLLLEIEPFDTKALVPYKPEYLSGMAAEDYRRDMVECWTDAVARVDDAIRAACTRQIPGDTHRNLRVRTSYHNRTYKLSLLPVWVAAYRYGGASWAYIVNGRTGEVAGTAPWSWVKILAAAATVAALIGGIVYAQSL